MSRQENMSQEQLQLTSTANQRGEMQQCIWDHRFLLFQCSLVVLSENLSLNGESVIQRLKSNTVPWSTVAQQQTSKMQYKNGNYFITAYDSFASGYQENA